MERTMKHIIQSYKTGEMKMYEIMIILDPELREPEAKKKLKENKEDTSNNFEVIKALTHIKKLLLEIKENL